VLCLIIVKLSVWKLWPLSNPLIFIANCLNVGSPCLSMPTWRTFVYSSFEFIISACRIRSGLVSIRSQSSRPLQVFSLPRLAELKLARRWCGFWTASPERSHCFRRGLLWSWGNALWHPSRTGGDQWRCIKLVLN